MLLVTKVTLLVTKVTLLVTEKALLVTKKTIEIVEGKNQLIQSNQCFVEPVTKWDNVRTNSLDIDIEIDTYNSNYNSISTALEYYSSKIGVPSSETRSKLHNLEQQYSFEEIKVAVDVAWKQKKGIYWIYYKSVRK